MTQDSRKSPFKPGLLAASGSRGGHFLELSGLTFPLGVSVLSPAPGRHRRRGERFCAGKISPSAHHSRASVFCIQAAAYFLAYSKFLSHGNLETPRGLSWRSKLPLLKPAWAGSGQFSVEAGPIPASKPGLGDHPRQKNFGLGSSWDIFSDLVKPICADLHSAALNPWPTAV